MKIPELHWPKEPPPYDDDLLLDLEAGTVVLLIRGRNAWHSTWVRHYLRNSTLYTDVASAKMGAEKQRGPGNVFYIVEAPALLASGQRSKVVLCDAHPDNPFGSFAGIGTAVKTSRHGSWIDGLFPGVSVHDAATAFKHDSGHWSGPTPSQHSLRTGMLDRADLFDTTPRVMQSLVSRPIGTNYYLRWDPNPAGNRYTRRGANYIARLWAETTASVVEDHAQPEARAIQLQRHRDDVMQVLPKSQWLSTRQIVEDERRAAKQSALERWIDASNRVSDLREALREAWNEQAAAQAARMEPATMSAGVRAQRERVERAAAEIALLTAEIAGAQQEANKLRTRYTEFS